jgi:tetratricopeptide (TPR) repeat protein
MQVRQEPIVFVVSALFLGWMSWGLLGGGTTTRASRSRSGAETELERFTAPDPAIALPSEATPPLTRALFEPPSDTRPLAPLELVEPPRERLAGLLPPTDPGPAPSAYGARLRRVLEPADLPDLFADEDEPVADDDPAQAQAPVELEDLSAAQRVARIEAFKRRYDWVQKGELWFGRIENEDRYALPFDEQRANEPLLFVRFDPDTGADFYKGIRENQIAIERGTVSSFGFAGTVANRIELEARRIGEELTRGTFAEALQLANTCIENRLEAPRALEIAEHLYGLCAAYDPKDPEPLLGRARCREAAFDFEGAFAQYQELLESFGHREEVHTRLARLEERFLMFEQAEARLQQALGMNQGSWVARFALGGFLERRGRPAEAIEHLTVANRNAPKDPESLATRVAIRTTLGDAHLALGDLPAAEAAYRSALQADAGHQRALAGATTAAFLAGEPVPASSSGAGAGEAGFELLLARGVAALASGNHVESRAALELAVRADPLRADHALAALSVLAEVTGHAEEAMRFAEEALERNPISPFALFQRGRLLGLQDDYQGARGALLGALGQELDFEDALVALGEMAFRLGQFEDAERYLERAVGLNAGRAEVHGLRGLNLLRLGSVGPAREAFEAALALAPADPTAQAGRAWCVYLDGDPGEALIQLGHIVEQRRNQPEDDDWKVWAAAQIERLSEHLRKVEWTDSFSRKRLANGWQTRESSGPTVALVDATAHVEGRFTSTGDVRLFRPYQGGDFVSIEADVKIDSGRSNALIGLFAARERPRRDGTEIVAEVSVARHIDGNVQLRFQRVGQPAESLDMRQVFPLDQWVRLRIERNGESSESTVTFYLDGIPLAQNVAMPALGQVNSPLMVGLFAEGETAREISVSLDNVSIVTRNPR